MHIHNVYPVSINILTSNGIDKMNLTMSEARDLAESLRAFIVEQREQVNDSYIVSYDDDAIMDDLFVEILSTGTSFVIEYYPALDLCSYLASITSHMLEDPNN